MEELYVEGLATRGGPHISHASTSREGVAKRWQGHVQAGLLSREISVPGCPHCPKGGRQHRWRR
jgi:hypothetical protein